MTKRVLLSMDPDAALMGGKSRTGYWSGERMVEVPERKKRGAPEAAIQRAIKTRLTFHGIVCVAFPNEGRRTAAGGRRMKQQGLLPGMPDLLVMQAPGRVGFLEVKAPQGRVSEAQAATHDMLRRLGFNVSVVRSHDDAVAMLQEWGFRL